MQRLLDIKTTQLEMVQDRGYNLSPKEAEILGMDVDRFTKYIEGISDPRSKKIWSVLSNIYTAPNPDGSQKIIVIFYAGRDDNKKQIAGDTIKTFIDVVRTQNAHEAVLIADAILATEGSKQLRTILPPEKRQIFYDQELTYNPIRHVDTPKHELLPDPEAIQVLEELKVDKQNLLIIKADDIVVRYYGWKPCGIVKVLRYDYSISILTPHSINYRVIIE